jgi:oxygen-independent coproporphyrinogen-3 oxidase
MTKGIRISERAAVTQTASVTGRASAPKHVRQGAMGMDHHDARLPQPSRGRAPGSSLYIHVPFCEVRCPYCHFYCFVNRDPALPRRYAAAVRGELALHRARLAELGPVQSVYFGGGTPSALPGDARADLCAWLTEEVRPLLAPDAEITLEVNPESARPDVLRAWLQAGVNRISLGIQSMDEDVLRFLGRLNTPQSNRGALELACQLVDNVSVDLILATPGSDWPGTLQDLNAVAAFPVTHVSAYLLEIHSDTRFGRDVAAGRWRPQPDDAQSELYLRAGAWLAGRGFVPYELSNFGQPGFASRHNQRYWQRLPYFGLGPSACSFFGERRWENHRDAQAYCADLERGQAPTAWVEELSDSQRRMERILLGLRTVDGIPRSLVADRQSLLEAWAAAGLVELRGNRVVSTVRGWLVLDQIVQQLTAQVSPVSAVAATATATANATATAMASAAGTAASPPA